MELNATEGSEDDNKPPIKIPLVHCGPPKNESVQVLLHSTAYNLFYTNKIRNCKFKLNLPISSFLEDTYVSLSGAAMRTEHV
jgi:hypothetical protein